MCVSNNIPMPDILAYLAVAVRDWERSSMRSNWEWETSGWTTMPCLISQCLFCPENLSLDKFGFTCSCEGVTCCFSNLVQEWETENSSDLFSLESSVCMSIVAVLIRLISTKASRWKKKASQWMPIHRKGKNIVKCFANESCLESKEKTLKHIKRNK